QADKLAGVFSGQMSGPMAALAPLIAEVLGIEQHPIEYRDSGHKHHLKIGNDIAIDVEDYVPQGFTEPTKLVGVFHPSNTTLTMARPTESRIKAFGMEFHNSGKSAFSAPFRWTPYTSTVQQRVAPLARPVSATIVAALLACAAVAWLITFRQ